MPHSDQQYLELALKQAEQSRLNGNHPFGAVLVDDSGDVLLAAENSVITQSDVTAHAELNLVRAATRTFDTEKLASCSIYSSAEPCPMCASAIVWANIRRVVFGLGMHKLYEVFGDVGEAPTLKMESRSIFKLAPWPVTVLGPILEKEALEPHKDFW